VPWLRATLSLNFDGCVQVAPQLFERENMIFEWMLLSPPTNDV
jgi:hypothetical protein